MSQYQPTPETPQDDRDSGLDRLYKSLADARLHSKPSSFASQDDNDVINLSHLLGILLDNKRMILSLIVIFAIGGMIYAFQATPIYRSDALVQVEKPGTSVNPLVEVTSLLGQEPPSESEIEIIRSRMVLGRAVDLLNLDLRVDPIQLPLIGQFINRMGIERPGFIDNLKDTWFGQWARGYTWSGETVRIGAMPVADDYLGHPFLLRVIDDQRYELNYQDQPIGEGRVGVPVEFLEGDISLTVESINAPPGATFNVMHERRLMAIANLRNHLSVTEQGKETGILRLGMTSPEPLLAENILATVADIYVAQNIQRQSEEARNSLQFLNGQVPVVREELSRAESLLNAYRTDRDSVDLSLETQSILERLVNLEAQLNELGFAEAEISRRFTTSHPTYSALLEKKAQLNQEKTSLEGQVSRLPETQQEILRLQRDVTVTQAVYVQLRNKVQEMQISEASTVGNVRMLDAAEVFPAPVSPNKKLIVIVATFIGALVAVGLVLLRNILNHGIEVPDELERLGLPVYATVPLAEAQEKLNRYVRRGGKRHSATSGLLAMNTPGNISIEALRGLRTSLHFAMLESNDKRLMITGPNSGVGKSFIAINLGAVYTQLDKKVLIIDADMRKGHIHGVFGGRAEGGLSDVLVGKQLLEEVVRPVQENEKLHYISRGTTTSQPAELLASPVFKDLLDVVSNRYDLVIVDSPPILAVTDAALIGKLVGTTLLVARFQRTTPKEVRLAIRRLDTVGVALTGAILNAVERKASTAYGYGYSYS